MLKTCLDDTGLKIVAALYQAVQTHTTDPGLLSIIGSWGDTLDDTEILDMAKRYNEMGEPFAPAASVR